MNVHIITIGNISEGRVLTFLDIALHNPSLSCLTLRGIKCVPYREGLYTALLDCRPRVFAV
jgi:hypothetical protein